MWLQLKKIKLQNSYKIKLNSDANFTIWTSYMSTYWHLWTLTSHWCTLRWKRPLIKSSWHNIFLKRGFKTECHAATWNAYPHLWIPISSLMNTEMKMPLDGILIDALSPQKTWLWGKHMALPYFNFNCNHTIITHCMKYYQATFSPRC